MLRRSGIWHPFPNPANERHTCKTSEPYGKTREIGLPAIADSRLRPPSFGRWIATGCDVSTVLRRSEILASLFPTPDTRRNVGRTSAPCGATCRRSSEGPNARSALDHQFDDGSVHALGHGGFGCGAEAAAGDGGWDRAENLMHQKGQFPSASQEGGESDDVSGNDGALGTSQLHLPSKIGATSPA